MRTMKIFIDTEFTDFNNCDLISLGMVAENGEEFYAENLDFAQQWASNWVQLNVLNLCDFGKYGMKRAELGARAYEWLEQLDCNDHIIVVDYATDYILLERVMGTRHHKMAGVEHIFHHVVTHALSKGGDGADLRVAELKEIFNKRFNQYFRETGEIQHHALSDARANRVSYATLMDAIQGASPDHQ